jgi:predicted component of type VI protein secretion system
MPYLIITDKKQELDRHDLAAGPAVIGRSPECDLVVRDVLLSRRHMKVEPVGERWVVSDLGSKNGTFVDNQRVDRHVLGDGEVVRAGRTRIVFRAGKYEPPPPEVVQRKASRRPADPHEALSGTVMGFELTDMEENSRATGFPIPRPRPVEPAAYTRDDVDGLVKHLVASSEQYDLALRDAPPPPHSAAGRATRPAPEVVAREQDIRRRHGRAGAAGAGAGVGAPGPNGSARGTNGHDDYYADPYAAAPNRHATPDQAVTTPRWLALVYILAAYGLCALVLWLLSWT